MTVIRHFSDCYLTDICSWQFSDRYQTVIWLISETFVTYINEEYRFFTLFCRYTQVRPTWNTANSGSTKTTSCGIKTWLNFWSPASVQHTRGFTFGFICKIYNFLNAAVIPFLILIYFNAQVYIVIKRRRRLVIGRRLLNHESNAYKAAKKHRTKHYPIWASSTPSCFSEECGYLRD